MTITPPANIQYGTVVWRAAIDIEDSDDGDDLPDYVPPTGTVSFTPTVSKLIDSTATPDPVTILRSPITGVLDSDGYLCTPDADGNAGARGLKLIATDDADLNPTGWLYTVSYTLRVNGRVIQSPKSHLLDLPAGTTRDLTTVIPPDAADEIGVPQAEALAAQAVAAAQAAQTGLATKTDATAIGREQLDTQDFAKFKPLFAAIDARDTAKVDIGWMGPSTVAGYLTTWASGFAQSGARHLRQRFPVTGLSPYQGGTGVIPVPDGPIRGVGATASPQSTPWTFSASMQFDETGFSSGVNHTIAYTNGNEYGQITTDRDLTDIKVTHVKGTAGGAAAAYIRANALTAVTFSTAAGATSVGDDVFTAVALGFPGGVIPAGTVIKVGGMGTGAYFILSHVEGFYSDTAKGFHVHQIGHSGYDTTDWMQAVTGATTLPMIANLNLDFLILDFFAINGGSTGRTYPNGGSRTAAQWKIEMVAFLAWMRAGGVTCNILMVASYDPSGGVTLMSPWAAYVTAMQEIAAADATVAFYNHGLRMPPTAGGGDYYQADKTHLTERGNEIVTRGILDYVLDLKDEGIVGAALPGKADLVAGKVPASQVDPSVRAIPWRSGRWYASQYLGDNTTLSAYTAGTIYFQPITVPQDCTITDVGFFLGSVAASSSVQLGLYTDSIGAPLTRVRDFGNVATTAGGSTAKSIGSLAQPVTAGLYWLAVLPLAGAPTIQSHAAAAYPISPVGFSSPADPATTGWNLTGQTSLPASITQGSLATSTTIIRPRAMLKPA